MFSYGDDYLLLYIFFQILLQGKALYAQIFRFQAEGSSATQAALSAPVHLLSVEKATGWAGCAMIGNKEGKRTG